MDGEEVGEEEQHGMLTRGRAAIRKIVPYYRVHEGYQTCITQFLGGQDQGAIHSGHAIENSCVRHIPKNLLNVLWRYICQCESSDNNSSNAIVSGQQVRTTLS